MEPEQRIDEAIKAVFSDARQRINAYLKSDRFERDLRKFAQLYGVHINEEVLRTQNRELRVRNMVKAVFAKCGSDLRRNFLVGGGVGSLWGRLGAVRLAGLLGTGSAAVLAITAIMAILERDDPGQINQ